MNEITNEMKEFYEFRTNRHINLVRKYWCRLCGSKYLDAHQWFSHCENHDMSKFSEPERTPYIHLTWKYKCADENITYKMSQELEDEIHEATWHHIKNNPHHPEFWDQSLTENPVNKEDRDRPSGLPVDARLMQKEAIIEMVCDWCAVGEERGNSPIDWANANVNVRWMFTDEQARLIYEILNKLWKEVLL